MIYKNVQVLNIYYNFEIYVLFLNYSSNRIHWKKKENLHGTDNATDAGYNDQCMFLSPILEKIKETRWKFFQGSIAVL